MRQQPKPKALTPNNTRTCPTCDRVLTSVFQAKHHICPPRASKKG